MPRQTDTDEMDLYETQNEEIEDHDDQYEAPNPKRTRVEDANSPATTLANLIQQQNSMAKQLEKLDTLFVIRDQLMDQNRTMKQLTKTISYMENDMIKLKEENERLEKELKRTNLIFTGITDEEFESEDACLKKIQKCIADYCNIKTVSLDTAHRLGNYSTDRNRLIKVKLMKISDRRKILDQRNNFPDTIFVNEDLPKSTRQHHFLLRDAARIARNENKDVKIHWGLKEITINGKVSRIQDDKLVQLGQPNIPQSVNTRQRNAFLGKRPIAIRSPKPGPAT